MPQPRRLPARPPVRAKNAAAARQLVPAPSSAPAGRSSRQRTDLLALSETDPAFLAELGRRVRAAREQRGLPRKELSRSADVSERYLSQLEAGEGNASVILLRRVAAALGVRLTSLLDFSDASPQRYRRIALIGLRGAGKSTLGAALAKAMRRPLIELDHEIEKEAGIGLAEVFLLYGQAGFRRIERRCLERVIQSDEDIVLTVGGGIVSERDTYDLLLLNCFTVWIKAAPEEHMARVIAQGDTRPMAGNAGAMDDLRSLLSSREPLYARADITVDTSGSSQQKSFRELQRALGAG